MKIKILATLAFCAATFMSGNANAQLNPVPGLGFKLGDDVSAVKAALHTTMDVEPQSRNPALPSFVNDPNKGKTLLHLRTRGV